VEAGLEADREQRPGRLGRVAAALVGGVEQVAHLTQAVLLALPAQRHVADRLPRRGRDRRDVDRVALPLERRAPQLRRELLARARLPGDVADHVRIAVQPHEPVEVALLERAQQEPLGLDRVRRSQHEAVA
jgi:hypothetical protein